MSPPEHFLAILGVVLLFGLLLPQLLRPLRLPFATSLILVGSLLGPHGFGYVERDESLVLFGFLGAMFQMLLAGTEAQTLGIRLNERATLKILLANGALPAALGVAIARGLGFGWPTALFLGIVFLSSSIMLVFGIAATLGIDRSGLGRTLKALATVEDLAAALLAFVLFQTLEPHPRFPLPILAGLLLSSVLVLRMFLPEVVSFFFRRFEERGGDEYEARLRLVVGLLLLVIFLYSTLDVHPVIAAFLVGFALAEIPAAALLRARLETLGYGLFVPVFLFVVGIETDLGVLARLDGSHLLIAAVLVGAVGSKLLGGFAGGVWAGFAGRDAAVIAIASTTKLAVPLSASYAARDVGLLGRDLFSAVVIVSTVTSIAAPLVLSVLARRRDPEAPDG